MFSEGLIMATERARAHAVAKPWGVRDLRPFSRAAHESEAIGEIWYEREDAAAHASSLLLKLLFTSQPLSIQVHPDDIFARGIGLENGKTEAWYVLSAAPEAKLALGLKESLNPQQLRAAIDDGSIADLVVWRPVCAGDSFFVPAGSIHAIGAGLVIVEIQQRSDATFRLFDYGRKRELHAAQAVAVAITEPTDFGFKQTCLTPERIQVVSCPYFSMERFDLPPNSSWRLKADGETWVLGVSGEALAGLFSIAPGEAAFVKSASFDFHVGSTGLIALVAYTGAGPLPDLLLRIGHDGDFDYPPASAATVRVTGVMQ
jgi:mannose-6-phosphate isomerase